MKEKLKNLIAGVSALGLSFSVGANDGLTRAYQGQSDGPGQRAVKILQDTKEGQYGPNPFSVHALLIDKNQIPEGGYIMFFSHPDKPEQPNARYDRWELDTSVESDSVKVKGGPHAEHLVSDANFFLVGTQDRTDRLTPFYNKDNPAKVEKVAVVFDLTGQAVSKFQLDKTDFYPRFQGQDNYKGDPSLRNS